MEKSKITVEEFTTPSPVSVLSTDKLPLVWDVMISKSIRHVLVKDSNNKILGVLSQRDLTTFSQSQHFAEIEAQDIMSQDIVTVAPETKLYEVALRMSKDKIGSAIVYDPVTQDLGIFTATDALNALVEILRGDLDKELQI